MSSPIDVAILGAGPYGLSLASHLRRQGIELQIFGRPMHSWRAHMPAGMQLKSEGFASNLSDPDASFSLRQFCAERAPVHDGAGYADSGWAIPLDCFLAYGLAFQRRFVPEVDERHVQSVAPAGDRFQLDLEDGGRIAARRVFVATGLRDFRVLPPELAGLPDELVYHSADLADPTRFRGRRVVVIGGGSSAVELATLLHEAGAEATLVTRREGVAFQPPPAERPIWRRALRPLSGIGYGWHSQLIADAPQLFRLLPAQLRKQGVAHYLAPAAGWFVRDRFVGRVAHLAGYRLLSAGRRGTGVELRLRHLQGKETSLACDHVVAATGYRPALGRLAILGDALRARIRQAGGAPLLSASFESSVPGLHFIGPLSADCFGPAMRFVLGARFTALRVSRYAGRSQSRAVMTKPAPALAG